MSRRLIVALDTPDLARARLLAAETAPRCALFKLGFGFFLANRPTGAVRAVLPLALRMVTLHAAGEAAMIEAAQRAAEANAATGAYRLVVGRPNAADPDPSRAVGEIAASIA